MIRSAHTFWNATDEPARLMEIISPAGFEQLFVEATELARPTVTIFDKTAAFLLVKHGLEREGVWFQDIVHRCLATW